MPDIREYWEALLDKYEISSDTVSSISEPAAATAATVTFTAPGAGFRWVVLNIVAFYTTAAPTAQYLTAESPSTTFKLRYPLGTAIDTPKEPRGEIIGGDNAAMIITVPSGGGTSVARLYATAVKVKASS